MSEATKQLDALYEALPQMNCKGLCHECCGPIAMSRVEWQRIQVQLGYTPKGTPDLVCPMLDRKTNRCSVYAIRPVICRLWGALPSMPCPHGCQPERMLDESEGHVYLFQADLISDTADDSEVTP